jgi:hypothetical protein
MVQPAPSGGAAIQHCLAESNVAFCEHLPESLLETTGGAQTFKLNTRKFVPVHNKIFFPAPVT